MVIQHNMQAMNTNRQLGISVGAAAKSTEKLSSGYRINRAGDDAAGLAISEKMRSQIRGLDRASANSQDGISLIQTAEGALSESQNILQRMRELSVQAANGTNTGADREEIQKEINQLTSEINRIANTTEFNTMKLLRGNGGVSDTGESSNIGNFKVINQSSKGSASTAVLVGGSSNFTGKVSSALVETTKSVAATPATDTVAGIKFETINTTADTKTIKVEIVSGTATESVTATAGGTDIVIKLTQDSIDKFNNAGDIAKKLKDLKLEDVGLKVVAEESASIESIKNKLGGGPGTVITGGTLGSHTVGVAGDYTFEIASGVKEQGDTIEILGQTFTAVNGAADASKGEFSIGTGDAASQAASLAAAINANAVLKDKITATATAGGTDGKIKIEDKTNYEGTIAKLGTSVKQMGAGGDDTLTITNPEGTNGVIYKLKTGGSNLNVSINASGIVDITLGSNPADNTAEKIQEKIRALKEAQITTVDGEKVTVDFSSVTTTAKGNWDTIMKADMVLDTNKDFGVSGDGIKSEKGKYSFSVVDGDSVTIAGKKFIAQDVASLVKAIQDDANIGSKYEVENAGGSITLTEKKVTGRDLNKKDVSVGSSTSTSEGGNFEVILQVGANTGQSMTISIGDTRSLALGVSSESAGKKTLVAADGKEYSAMFTAGEKNVTDGSTNEGQEYALDVTSFESATSAISIIDDALSTISSQRSQLGAYQNRLEHTIANLDNTSENLQSAESRIRDVDMAKEMTNFSKNNILQQAAQSMLAQANQSTQGVLTLLR